MQRSRSSAAFPIKFAPSVKGKRLLKDAALNRWKLKERTLTVRQFTSSTERVFLPSLRYLQHRTNSINGDLQPWRWLSLYITRRQKPAAAPARSQPQQRRSHYRPPSIVHCALVA